ncbi:hypothetical protein ACWDT6_09555 [Nocardia grenadensis]
MLCGRLCGPSRDPASAALADRGPGWRTVDPIGPGHRARPGVPAGYASRCGSDLPAVADIGGGSTSRTGPALGPDRSGPGLAGTQHPIPDRRGPDRCAGAGEPGAAGGVAEHRAAVRNEEPGADGWLRLEVTFQDTRHAEWALWQLTTDAEVLAPSPSRTCLRDRAAAIVARYATR